MVNALWAPSQPLPRDLRTQLVDEVDEKLSALRNDIPWAIVFWSHYRDRTRMLEIFATDWESRNIEDLLALHPRELVAVSKFFEALERNRCWLSESELMPGSLERRLDAELPSLDVLGEQAREKLQAHHGAGAVSF